MKQKQFIFEDLKGLRWRRVRAALLLLFVACIIVLTFFVKALFVKPKIKPPQNMRVVSGELKKALNPEEIIHLQPSPPDWLKAKRRLEQVQSRKPFRRHKTESNGLIRLAFYVSWDPRSLESLMTNFANLTHVAPEWFSLVNSEEDLLQISRDDELLDVVESTGIKIVPMLTNLTGDDWQPEVIENLALKTKEEQADLFSRIADEMDEIDAEALLVDWEQVDSTYQNEISALFEVFAKVLNDRDKELWLSVPVGNDAKVYDLQALQNSVDKFVALLYDENGEKDSAGPMASQVWWNEWLQALMENGRPEQWIAGLGSFGYDWLAGHEGEAVGFIDVMARAGMAGEGAIEGGPPHYQPHFLYDDSRGRHSVWFLDAVTFRNEMQEALRLKLGGFALYRLGSEDPGVWDVIHDPELRPAALEVMKPVDFVSHIGEGDLLTAVEQRAEGKRSITVSSDPSQLWITHYEKYPSYPLLYHRGAGRGTEVVLSFDDGPDAEWTPRILDILKEKGVKAVFFVVGRNAVRNPNLVRRIVAEGHEIGNHSFTHPDLSQASLSRMLLELNATQRAIESAGGVSSVLFRPPFHAERQPETYAQFLSLIRAQELGYIPVSESVDSEDWLADGRQEIIERVKAHLREGNVLLFHDGGGDRSFTVEALPDIIDYLRKRGNSIVPISELAGMSKDMLQTKALKDEAPGVQFLSLTGMEIMRRGEELFWAFLIVVTALVLLRSVLVIWLALKQKNNEKQLSNGRNKEHASVSVVIAAYNEERVIESTLRSIIRTDFPGALEIIVVDDGSRDNTAEVVEKLSQEIRSINLLKQSNTGKARALQRGLSVAAHEFVVMLDADTNFQLDTISELIKPFKDEDVGAVSGTVRVGNIRNTLTRFQDLEYICGFNLDKRAYDVWDCITVVPGAVCAVRRSAVAEAGGFSSDTLAEDTDLTLALHRHGWSVRYACNAVAWTEAPETVWALARQRVRWAFGTLQCLWKHRDLVFNPGYGALAFFSLPGVWFAHVFLVALTPVLDLLLILSLVQGGGSGLVEYAVFFFGIEWAVALIGCMIDGQKKTKALMAIPMRFLYRPLLAYAVWVSIVRAIKGAWVGWGKAERRGIFNNEELGGTV